MITKLEIEQLIYDHVDFTSFGLSGVDEAAQAIHDAIGTLQVLEDIAESCNILREATILGGEDADREGD